MLRPLVASSRGTVVPIVRCNVRCASAHVVPKASTSGPAWNPWEVFDADEDEKRRVAERAALRQRNKTEFQRQLTNPFELQPHCYRIGYIVSVIALRCAN